MMQFTFGPARSTALPSGALWWADQRLLCISDLHLGKSERMARRAGALLPPYEGAETLERLARDIGQHDPQTVICLGDSVDDLAAGAGLDTAVRMHLAALQAGRRWLWIEGNHDAGSFDLDGAHLVEFTCARLVFRHIAQPGSAGGNSIGEVSGHYHPKAYLAGQYLPAFVLNAQRLIVPAYGTYTGGLRADRAPLADIIGPNARALVCRLDRVLQIPLQRR